jgi:glycosyltransferase involved in cell wall biosynthesis
MLDRAPRRRLKVLVLPSWYPTERYPMGGIFCQEQARALNEALEVEVVVLFVDRAPILHWLRRLRNRPQVSYESSLKVYRTVMPRLPVVWPFLYVPWAFLSLLRLRRHNRFTPDIVHAHVALPAGLAGVLIKRLLRIPLIVTEHTGPFSMLMRNPLAARATTLALRSADRVIAVSLALRRQMWEYPQLHRHIDIVPNVVDTDAFYRPRSGRSFGPYKLLFVGEMNTDIKGVEHLLAAISLLAERDLEVRLDLVGDGRNRGKYEALARSLGVSKLCRFLGTVSHDEIARLMSEAELLVMPSLAETFGVVVAEALAAGLPVVATRCGGPEEIVTPDVGLLVEPGDAQALADGIAATLEKLDDYPAGHLHHVAETRYGQASVARRLVDLYRRVVS